MDVAPKTSEMMVETAPPAMEVPPARGWSSAEYGSGGVGGGDEGSGDEGGVDNGGGGGSELAGRHIVPIATIVECGDPGEAARGRRAHPLGPGAAWGSRPRKSG